MSVSYPSVGEMRIRRRGEDWKTIPLYSPLTVQSVASFPPKVTIGETTKGSHPMLSTWAFGGLTGGSGITRHDGTTTHRYREGLVDARNAQFFGSPRAIESFNHTGAFMPHNDLVVSSVRRMYGSFGTDLYIWDETGGTWTDTTQNLTAAAVNPGVAFKGTGSLKLFIPCGSTGYATWDGTTLTNVAASGTKPAARDFAQLGTQLICLDVSGQLWYSTDASTWSTFAPAVTLDAGVVGNRLAVYKNGFGDKTIHIATNCGLFTFDPTGPTLYDTDLALPPHPQQGKAIARWRDQLYISAGMGVYQWNGSAVSMMGLDRGQGLSSKFRGEIVDMVGTLNDLFVLVDTAGSERKAIHAWTGEGWHCLWNSDEEAFTTATRLVVSSAQDGYRLWWSPGTQSTDGIAMTYPLTIDGANIEQLALTGEEFTRNWNILTGETDMEMAGFTKIAVSLEWEEFGPDDAPLYVYYNIDSTEASGTISPYTESAGGDGSWHDRHYDFGYDAVTDAYLGTPFERIEFFFAGLPYPITDSYTGPGLVRNAVLTFQKVPTGFRAWSTPINLQQYYDNNQENFAELINELVLDDEYCLFQYQQEEIRVKFASWSGVDETGQANHGGMRRISIIEIPTTP